MFPIRDKRERVVGFGGRVLDDSLPKYLNSPETAVFSKGREAYGLYEFLEKKSKSKRILVVEGYMDVIALAQHGIHYAVATLGTAASKTHLDFLFRYCSEVVFCFDGDKAGQQAAWRAMDIAFASIKEGRSVRVMLLPEGQDPDTMIREEGKEAFASRVEHAKTLSEYFFERLVRENDLVSMEGRARLVEQATPYLDKLVAGVFKTMMLAQLKKMSGLASLDVSKNTATLNGKREQSNQKIAGGREKGRLSTARVVIALLLQNPELARVVEHKAIDWQDVVFSGADVFKSVLSAILEQGLSNTAVLMESFRSSEQENVVRTLACLDLMTADDEIEIVFSDALDKLLLRSKKEKQARMLSNVKLKDLSKEEREVYKKMLTESQSNNKK